MQVWNMNATTGVVGVFNLQVRRLCPLAYNHGGSDVQLGWCASSHEPWI